MKCIFIFLTFFFSTIFVTAQNFVGKDPSILSFASGKSDFRSGDDAIDSTLYFTWAEDHWEILQRSIFTLNEDGIILTEVKAYWDGNEWFDQTLDTYTYLASGHVSVYLIQNWDGANWVNSSHHIYTYNDDGNETSRLTEVWNGLDWENSYEFITTYNGNLIATQESRLWLNNNWVQGLKHLYTYENSRVTHILTQAYYDEWVNTDQIFYTYLPNGDGETGLSQKWVTDHWENDYRYLYEYDDNHHIVNFKRQLPDGSNWVDEYQFFYMYDANFNITGQLFQYYINNEWVDNYRFIVAYDKSDNRISEVYQEWDSVWINVDSLRYYYSESSGFNDVASAFPLLLYPNPAVSSIYIQAEENKIDYSHIQIFTSNGQLVATSRLNNKERELDIHELMPGTYHLMLLTPTGVNMKTFIKQ